MHTPFFSIVIPTKGRSFLVGNAVESVLRQSFKDFEVVVVDNDDGEATRKALTRFEDSRFRHFRTGGLSMPDNWDRGCREARGEYMLLLEDKQALHSRALERVHELIEQHQPPCVRWIADVFDDSTGSTWVEEAGGSGEARFAASEEVLRTFLSGPMNESWKTLPIGHWSAFGRQLRNAILGGPVARFCPPVNPDYTIGIQALAFGEGVLCLDEALTVTSRRHSNGRSIMEKTALGKQFMAELGGPSRLWSRTPIETPIIPAMIYNDYLELRDLIGGRLREFPIDWVNYYVEAWRSVLGLDNDGVPVKDEFAAFHLALSKETPEMQEKVWSAIEAREGPPAASLGRNRRKALRRRTGLLAIEQGWKLFSRRLTGRRHVGRFRNPLEFVVWAENHGRRARQAPLA